jgi:hypothetical protein
MRYEWKKELKTLGASLFYYEHCADELIKKIDSQWETIDYMISSIINRRFFTAPFIGRTGKSLKILPYEMKNFLGYDGRTRPCAYVIFEDDNITRHKRNDVAIVGTGTTTTGQAIQAMEILTDSKVKTFLWTHTTLEEMRKKQKRKPRKSAWDYFVKQPDFEKHVLYLPKRESNQKDNQKRGSLSPLGSRFEIDTAVTARSVSDCIRDYHLRCEGTDTIPLKTMSYSLDYYKRYLSDVLIPHCHKYQDKIIEFADDIMGSNHIKVVASGESDLIGSCCVTRIAHFEYDGRGKSVNMIRSTDYGPPGSSNLTSDDFFIALSISGGSKHTNAVVEEAVKKRVKKISLITSIPKTNLKVDSILTLPYTYPGYQGELAHLGLYVFLNSVIAQIAKNKHKDEKDMERLHSQYG